MFGPSIDSARHEQHYFRTDNNYLYFLVSNTYKG